MLHVEDLQETFYKVYRKEEMSLLRSFRLLPVRIFDILGWTVDPQNYAQPFLSAEQLRRKQEISYPILKKPYIPPAFKPSKSTFQN